jgi:hypothetical protein
MLSKWEIGALVAGGIYLLSKPSKAASQAGTKVAVTKNDADLLKRASQSRAQEWVPILVYDLGIPQAEADADARWFGIESSGDPRAVSSQGERGLAQITKTSALKEGALTQAEWDAMADVTTSIQEQARIALKVIAWCYQRATKYIKVPPVDPIEHLFYAKLYHQSPVEVRDAKLTGDAHADAARLEQDWASDAKKLHHLHAANVVAWGSVLPPTSGES